MSEWLSSKFKWMSIVATFAVVGLHSDIGRGYTQFIKIAYDVFAFAVPTFFLISGYLFVGSARKYSYGQLLKKKFFSLYVPVVVAAILIMVIDTPIRIFSHEPYSWWEYLRSFGLVFSIGCLHLWYVRALLIFFLFAPIILFAIRKWYFAVGLILLATCVPCGVHWYALNVPRSVVFFLLGGLLATYVGAERVERWAKFWWVEILIGGGLLMVCLATNLYGPVKRILLPIGEIAVLSGGYDLVGRGAPPAWLDVMFFVYLFHAIIISYTGGAMRLLRQRIDIPSDLLFCLGMLTFFGDVVVANIIRACFPRVYGALTGGRLGIEKVKI